MAFPSARNPYIVRVTAVTVDGTPVSGAVITLYNSTKGTNTAKTSSETNSNITINLSECGDWSIGDIIYVKALYGGNVASSSNHTTSAADNGKFEFGTVAITSGIGSWKKIMWSDDPMSITVRKNSGTNIGTRQRLNFVEGSNVTLAITDDAGSGEIDISISASGGGAADHGALTGLADDDHTQYLLADGTRPLAGNWNPDGNCTRKIGDISHKLVEIWAANGCFGDIVFEERNCHICGGMFKDGDILSLVVTKTTSGGTHTVPIHSCCGGIH